jgi:threonine dehydrogenase-like Zn-dependent dehydrogenase
MLVFLLSRATAEFQNDSTLSWDELKPQHLIVSEEWEADTMVALAEFPGSVKDGGKGRDNVRVKRRVVIDVPLGRGSHACYKNMRFMMHVCSHRSRQ